MTATLGSDDWAARLPRKQPLARGRTTAILGDETYRSLGAAASSELCVVQGLNGRRVSGLWMQDGKPLWMAETKQQEQHEDGMGEGDERGSGQRRSGRAAAAAAWAVAEPEPEAAGLTSCARGKAAGLILARWTPQNLQLRLQRLQRAAAQPLRSPGLVSAPFSGPPRLARLPPPADHSGWH